MPVTLDVGTNNESLLNDPLYIGLEQRRVRGEKYDELIEEFLTAAMEKFPGVLIQLEDFGTANAFRLLETYRERACLFDDDIQGTGAVALAGLLAAMRVTGGALEEQRILFLGAGEAGIGIADTVVAGMMEQGVSKDAARRACWFVDTQGLLTSGRDNVPPHKRAYAHDHAPAATLKAAIEAIEPTVLIGVSAQSGMFDEAVVRTMARLNERPLIFALSNPTSKAECTAEDAYRWSDGRAVFASGSPFDPVKIGNRTLVPGQGNNAYIFPGVGLGAIISEARAVTDEMFLAAAFSLARQVSDADLAEGRVYPALSKIRDVSAEIARDVAIVAWKRDLTTKPAPEDVDAEIRGYMYEPVYPHYA